MEVINDGIGTVGTGDINIEVKLPTSTAWLDYAKIYNSTLGVSTDGCGCLSGSISYISASNTAAFNVTFGGKTSSTSNKILFMRITLNNTNRTIKKINCLNW